jgi:hypothetical protein
MQQPWKVTIRPTRSGIRIRTQASCGSAAAEIVERAVTEALLRLKNQLEQGGR